jgi:amidohydrolase
MVTSNLSCTVRCIFWCPEMLSANHDLCFIALACGHDFHVTCLLATVETALRARSEWSGTIIFLFQPAEERGTGAIAMVNDGLYDEKRHACPIPDLVLGQHVMPYRAGSVETKAGTMMSAADSFKVTIFGSGGHGSQPHRTIDAVVIASHIVVRLQTICSREVPPDETAVVTVGSIQAGDIENIIAAEAVLRIDIRSVTEEWRQRILASVKRIVKAECEAGRCPQEPVIERTRTFPVTHNDKEVNDAIEESFSSWFKEKHKSTAHAQLVSEDVSILASSINKPCCFWFFGGIDAAEWDEREKNGTLHEISVNHSAYFAPVLQPTLKTGVEALSVAILTFLGKSKVELLHGSADI